MSFDTLRKPSVKPSPSQESEERRRQQSGGTPTTKSPDSTIPRYLRAQAGMPLFTGRERQEDPRSRIPRYLWGELDPISTQSPKSPAAPTTTAPAAAAPAHLGKSEPLAPEAASRFSRAYGQDLSGVRVHPDSPLPGALGARALAVGNDIAFARDAYQPGSSEGQQLLGHELAHVVQQSKGQTGLQAEGLSSDGYERQADDAARAALAGQPVAELSPLASPTVQRKAADAPPPPAPAGREKPRPGKVPEGVVDLSKGLLDPAHISPDANGRVLARLPGLAEGEIELEQRGEGYSTRGQGYALPLALGPLAGVLGDSLVLVVRIDNNVISGRAAVGKPGPSVPKGDSALFRALEKNPEALGWVGLSKLSVGTPKNALEGGALKLGADAVRFTLGGFVEGTASFSMEGERVTFSGSAEVKIPGAATGSLPVSYSPEKGLEGEAHLEVGLGKVSGGVDARLRQGVLDIQGTVGYAGDRLKGSITLTATDAETAREITRKPPQSGGLPGQEAGGAAAGAGAGAEPAAAKPGPRAFCGWGELDFSLAEWLTGRVKVVVNSQGEATVQGEIAPPSEIILFEQKDWTKSLLKAEARALYGVPVVGNVFVFANVGLEALASIGPGKLYNIKMSGQYSTDKQADKELNLQASLNISAFAGLRLRAEGGAGVELLDHDIKFGVGVWALAGVRGYVEATPTIGYREKGGGPGEFYLKGHMELAAQPFLGLGGDLFVEVDSPIWSPLPDDKWTWPLGSIEYPLPGEFGLGADVEHVLGSKQWPEIQFTEVEFDTSRFMSDLLSQSAPGKGKGGEDKNPAKWDDGRATGAPGGAKGAGAKGAGGAAPTKAPATGGKKGTGGKSAKGKGAGGKPGKNKDAGAPGQVGESVTFNAKGEAYRLWVKVSGKSATLMVARPQQSATSWIAAQERQVGNLPKDEQKKAQGLAGEARALASSIDKQADRVASGTGDKGALQQGNAQVQRDEHRLAGLLRQLAELSGGEKGELTIGEPVPFSEGKKPHRLYFVVKGSDAVLTVASTPTPLSVRLDDFAKRLEGAYTDAEGKEAQGVGYFSDLQQRDRARELLNRARALSKELDVDADTLVREHRKKMATASSEEKLKIYKEERSLAAILSELYWMFGERPGEADFNLRARYSGAGGAGELVMKRRSSLGKTLFVVGSGPLFESLDEKRGRVVEAMDALQKQISSTGAEQTLLAPPQYVVDQIPVLKNEAKQAGDVLTGFLKGETKVTKEAAVADTTKHLQAAAASASVIAAFKRVGGGELVERAVTQLADEKRAEARKKGLKGKTAFELSTEIRHELERKAEIIQVEDAALQVEFEKKRAERLATGEPLTEEEKTERAPRSKTGSRFSVAKGIFTPSEDAYSEPRVNEEYIPAIVSSYRGALVSALGTYEEIRPILEKALPTFASELLHAFHQNQELVKASAKERRSREISYEKVNKKGKLVKRKMDQHKLVANVRVLFHVEITRAAAAWAFGVNKLLHATSAQEAADAFKTDVYPHALKGFMEDYRNKGASIFDEAAKALFADLKVRFNKDFHLDKGKHVFLTHTQLEEAIQTLKAKLAEMYETAHSKKETT